MEENVWRKCSSCKKPIAFKTPYQRCSVSTCNQARVSLVFCTVSCWSAHVPVYRHRDAWAVEETSPSREEWAAQSASLSAPAVTASATPRPAILVRTTAPQSAAAAKNIPKEVLVVVSKLKQYIRDTSEMNTSAEVADLLSDKIRKLCDAAVRQARSDGRKTVMGRDF